tara:strand:- start:2 stop:121 length:120 start_codon:yes stop_codon:yes gene_type:complete
MKGKQKKDKTPMPNRKTLEQRRTENFYKEIGHLSPLRNK